MNTYDQSLPETKVTVKFKSNQSLRVMREKHRAL